MASTIGKVLATTGERLFCNVNVLVNRKPQFFSEPFPVALMPGRQHAVAELADPGFGAQRNVHKSIQRKTQTLSVRTLDSLRVFSPFPPELGFDF
jgi:hypothetical protein